VKHPFLLLPAIVVLLIIDSSAWCQSETVPVGHPVYQFLKRMEVKGAIVRFHDSVLPISRSRVASFLVDVRKNNSADLSDAEKGFLRDFLREFAFDISGSLDGYASLIDSIAPDRYTLFDDTERFLFVHADSILSAFVNGLLVLDVRGIRGDALGNTSSEFAQFGFRVRGTLLGSLGIMAQATNAQLWGSRDLLLRDPLIGQSFVLQQQGTRNFDFTEGYVRYDGDVVSIELGRERILWGTGYDQKMVLAGNVRTFDFIRAGIEYKSLQYTFLHGWLLGRPGQREFTLPFDTTAVFVEPSVADKYFAGHRLEFSFPHVLDVGAQEMVVYSNRGIDLAYLNPFLLVESAQRSREERDNVQWAFDVQVHAINGIELSGTMLFDDINFSEIFTNAWRNRFGFQVGAYAADPLSIRNTSFTMEYTRIEPFVFSHDRSREGDFGSLGVLLGPRIGPNADSWFSRIDVLPARNLILSFAVAVERRGENVVDSAGVLLRNVGGNFLQPHRAMDSPTKRFLDGILVKTTHLWLTGSWEFANKLWLDGMYEFIHERNTVAATVNSDHLLGCRVRIEW
jgi:Capsule assembly protein Wzi